MIQAAVKRKFTVNNNSPIQDYVHPDDQTQPTFEMTPGFKPFTVILLFFAVPAYCNYFYAFPQIDIRRCPGFFLYT